MKTINCQEKSPSWPAGEPLCRYGLLGEISLLSLLSETSDHENGQN
jgi:hypothetical protein